MTDGNISQPFGMELSANSAERLRTPETRKDAFEAMVRALAPRLYVSIRRMVLFHDDADDVLQNTFLKAWQGAASFRGDSSPYTWLYRIAVNECLDFLGRRHHTESLDDEVAEAARMLESDPYFDGDETELLLRQAVASLPEKQRVVFNLKYFEEMKYDEMSRLLGTSVGALKASYHLAVKKIERFFGEAD